MCRDDIRIVELFVLYNRWYRKIVNENLLSGSGEWSFHGVPFIDLVKEVIWHLLCMIYVFKTTTEPIYVFRLLPSPLGLYQSPAFENMDWLFSIISLIFYFILKSKS